MNPTIDVLLATYNGESFIRDFLESLVGQKNVNVNLYVSDDGSTDNTISIIEEFSGTFAAFELLSGPRIGPAMNFIYLLKHSKSQYIAFADQDDIWLPEHLISSIARIEKYENNPTITFSRVREFRREIANSDIWPENYNQKALANIFENQARGCTIVFNSKLRDIALKVPNKNMIMHDWWICLIACCVGKMVAAEDVEVLYRIHKNNFIGNRRKPFAFVKTVLIGEYKPIIQFMEIYQEIDYELNDELNDELINEFVNFAEFLNKRFTHRLKAILGNNFNIRSKKIDQIKLNVAFLLLPNLFRNRINVSRP